MINWYKKQGVTIRAAIIGGGFAILAGIIGGFFELVKPDPTIIVQVPVASEMTLIKTSEITSDDRLIELTDTLTPIANDYDEQSGTEKTTVVITEIPKGEGAENLSEPTTPLDNEPNKLSFDLALVRVLRGEEQTAGISFSPDGLLLAAAVSDGSVQIWNVNNGELLNTYKFNFTRGPAEISFSPDGQYIAIGGGDGDNTVIVTQASSMEKLLEFNGRTRGAFELEFSPNSKLLVAGGLGKDINILDIETGNQIQTLSAQSEIHSFSFSPDGQILAAASDKIILWRVEDWSISAILEIDHEYPSIWDVEFSPIGDRLAGINFYPGGPLYLWETSNYDQLYSSTWHNSTGYWSTDMQYTKDGRGLLLLVGTYIQIWDARNGELLEIIEGGNELGNEFTLSSDGTLLAVPKNNGEIMIWQLLDK